MINRLCSFKVYPGRWNPFKPPMRHYFRVHIFPDKQAMWNYGAKVSAWEKDGNGGYGALTVPTWRERITSEGDRLIAPKIGDVLFYRDLLGSECICHESVHMGTSYLRVLNLLHLSDQIDDNEEMLAYCIGSCARQIVAILYRQKIL